MATGNQNVLDIVREGEKILEKDIDEFFKYLYSDSFRTMYLRIQMNQANQNKYKLHLAHESLRFTHEIVKNWNSAANIWGLLMEWIFNKGVSINDSAVFALKATKLVSEPFYEYVPFVILTTFWDYGLDLYKLKDTIFGNYDEIAVRRSFDNDWVEVSIRKLLSRSDAEIDNIKREKKLLNLLIREKHNVRKFDSKKVLNDFEFKNPRWIKSIHFRIKMSVYNRLNIYAVSEKDLYAAISAGVIMQNVMSKDDIFKEFASLDEVFQILLKLFTTTYKFTIPDTLDEFWKYSDQLNC